MKVLVTGAGGQLGIDVVALFGRDRTVTGLTHAELDVGDTAAVRSMVADLGPDVVVNCAAWTAVDACEGDPERAHRVNAGGPTNLVAALAEFGGHLVQISPDYVFDGTKSEPYDEDDEPNPLSVYGASKLAGERACRASDTVVRTSWLMGPHRPNILTTILDLLAGTDDLHFVDDQRGCPTFTGDLACMIDQLVDECLPGTIHVTNSGPVTWYEFATEVARAFGHDPGRIQPIEMSAQVPIRPAPRPVNSVLRSSVLGATGPNPLRSHHEALVEAFECWPHGN